MLELVIWDVQHGSATYLKTPNNKHIIFDLGSGDFTQKDEKFSPLLHLKDEYGIKQIDQVIITHPHTDHIDDIMNFDALYPKIILRPKHLTEDDIRKANPSKDKKKIEKYFEINNEYSYPVNDSDNPTRPENNGGVNIQTFIPKNCGKSNINNHSVVSVIEYLGVKILLPGDNQSESWNELLNLSYFKDAIKGTNIYVAAHHGRESGYYSELFTYFKPDLVIISDGLYVETSATDRYSKLATGWKVFKRSENEKTSYDRKCLTTRKDGTIVIKVGKDGSNVFMNVTIE